MSEIIVKMDKHLKLKGGEYVRDIVRCKECYMCDEEMWCSFYDSIMESDDYCSYGDRKSDE